MPNVIDYLLNDIFLLTLIIVVITLIAVGVVLYFLVFKNKIKAKLAEMKARKEERARKIAEAKSLAQEVFSKRESDEDIEDDRASKIIKSSTTRFAADDGTSAKKKVQATDTETDFDFNLMKGKLNAEPEKKQVSGNTDTKTDFDFEALKMPKK